MPGKHGTLAERLERRLDKSGKCWLWTGFRNNHGYGQIGSGEGKRLIYTHHAAWIIANGPIPEGMYVLHSCDTPACCRPSHLHLGTQADNMREMVERGRYGTEGLKGEKHPMVKLTEPQVFEIRQRYAAGGVFQQELAKEYSMSQTGISAIITRKTWKHTNEF